MKRKYGLGQLVTFGDNGIGYITKYDEKDDGYLYVVTDRKSFTMIKLHESEVTKSDDYSREF